MFGSFQAETDPTALRPHQAGGHLQHLEAADVRVRGDRPRCASRDAVARSARIPLRAARIGARRAARRCGRIGGSSHVSRCSIGKYETHGRQRGSAARCGSAIRVRDRDGDRIGVVARRTGEFEVVVYPSDDPDQAQQVFRLTDDEAEALAQILGAPRIAERFADLTREVPGSTRDKWPSDPEARSSTGRSATPGRAPAPAPPSWRSSATRRSSRHRGRGDVARQRRTGGHRHRGRHLGSRGNRRAGQSGRSAGRS